MILFHTSVEFWLQIGPNHFPVPCLKSNFEAPHPKSWIYECLWSVEIKAMMLFTSVNRESALSLTVSEILPLPPPPRKHDVTTRGCDHEGQKSACSAFYNSSQTTIPAGIPPTVLTLEETQLRSEILPIEPVALKAK